MAKLAEEDFKTKIEANPKYLFSFNFLNLRKGYFIFHSIMFLIECFVYLVLAVLSIFSGVVW